MAVTTTLTTLLAGAVFGLALAAPPGPMNAVIAEESAVRGWRAGVRAGLGAMTADALFLLLSLAGLVAVVDAYPTLRGVMVGVGGLLMLGFAVDAARSARSTVVPAEEPASAGKGFQKALVLALTNPYQILFWLTVGVGLLQPGTIDVLAHTPYVGASLSGVVVVTTGTPVLLVGLFGGIGVWILSFPAAIVAARRRASAMGPVVAGVSAVVLAGFGVVFLWDAARTLV